MLIRAAQQGSSRNAKRDQRKQPQNATSSRTLSVGSISRYAAIDIFENCFFCEKKKKNLVINLGRMDSNIIYMIAIF
jgi:hypothetical protein